MKYVVQYKNYLGQDWVDDYESNDTYLSALSRYYDCYMDPSNLAEDEYIFEIRLYDKVNEIDIILPQTVY